MSLESAIQNLANEFKRYNDGKAAAINTPTTPPNVVTATQVTSPVTEAPKAEKPKAEKPAPKAEAPALSFAEVQTKAVGLVAAQGRDALVGILKAAGVEPVTENGKEFYKISSAKDQPKLLAKINSALDAALEATA